jgi:hypothetical protein
MNEQIDRQKNRQAGRLQKCKQMYEQINRYTDRLIFIQQTGSQADRPTSRQADGRTDRQVDR